MIIKIKYFLTRILRGKNPFKEKVFIISMQRSGTTSAGRFLEDCGYLVASNVVARRSKWIDKWLDGEYSSIIHSWTFRLHSGFQDSIFWTPDFYKYLATELPNTKFILLKRPSEDWFDSMLSHSGGMNPGDPYTHAMIYGVPLKDLKPASGSDISKYEKISLPKNKDLYVQYYETYNQSVASYFTKNGWSNRLFVADLYEDDLWGELVSFINCSNSVQKKKYHEHISKNR